MKWYNDEVMVVAVPFIQRVCVQGDDALFDLARDVTSEPCFAA
jgi:hypothetical protein